MQGRQPIIICKECFSQYKLERNAVFASMEKIGTATKTQH